MNNDDRIKHLIAIERRNDDYIAREMKTSVFYIAAIRASLTPEDRTVILTKHKENGVKKWKK
jgi:hypothetical protein